MRVVKKVEHVKFLQRRGWIDVSIFLRGGEEYIPQEEEIGDILDFFFSFHKGDSSISPTGIGGGIVSSRKVFVISYKPLGWEKDIREYYDTISPDNGEFRIIQHNIFLRDVGRDFAPDADTFERMSILNRLCERYANTFVEAVPPDDREYFEWYINIAASRVPAVEERHFRNNRISEFCTFSVTKDYFRLAYLTHKDDLIREEWDRQRQLPPEKYQDRIFMEIFTKLGFHNMVLLVLNDLWARNESWALFRLLERLKKGFVQGKSGIEKIPLIEARLLSKGEKIMGEWNREEMKKLLELSSLEFPEKLFE